MDKSPINKGESTEPQVSVKPKCECLSEMFQQLFDPNAENLEWDALRFTDPHPKMVFTHVAWIDLMGATHLMMRDPDAASRNIVRLHEAVFRALKNTDNKVADGFQFYPFADGVYIVHAHFKELKRVVCRVFRSYAKAWIDGGSLRKWPPIRASISFGRIATSDGLEERIKIAFKDDSESFLKSISTGLVVGAAFGEAHATESSAPPFGIRLSQSLVSFGKIPKKLHDGKNEETMVTWPLVRWWAATGKKEIKEARAEFARRFGERVLSYFDWAKGHPIDSGMENEKDSAKIESWKTTIREYFETDDSKGEAR